MKVFAEGRLAPHLSSAKADLRNTVLDEPASRLFNVNEADCVQDPLDRYSIEGIREDNAYLIDDEDWH